MKENPKVTIVTVVYNAASLIKETIESVLMQDYDNIEYIIIDGASQDETIGIIEGYENKITNFISEPDKGIYDAMNKGINIATGEWIIFMNAGDKFYSRDVLKNIFSHKLLSDIKVIVGSTLIHYSFGDYIVIPDKVEKLTRCMPFCHQSVFVRSRILKDIRFDSSLKITGDHKCLLSIYNKWKDAFYITNEVVADYDAKDGVSAKQTLKGYRESKDLTNTTDSLFRRFRIFLRANAPGPLLNFICRCYFSLDSRYKRI